MVYIYIALLITSKPNAFLPKLPEEDELDAMVYAEMKVVDDGKFFSDVSFFEYKNTTCIYTIKGSTTPTGFMGTSNHGRGSGSFTQEGFPTCFFFGNLYTYW